MGNEGYHQFGNRAAIVEASPKRKRMSNKAVRAFLAEGFKVYPIHPTELGIEEMTVHRSLRDIPGVINIASLYANP